MAKFLIVFTVGLIAAIIVFVPSVQGLGESAKIIFFHIPTAWTSVLAFFTSAFFAAKFLKSDNYLCDKISTRAAQIGFVFVILATVSGAIFSKLTWGAFWNWDPRQTTIFVLILIYGAYLILRAAITNEKVRARVSAIYSLLSVLTVPFLVFILPRMYFSLHPEPVINSGGEIKMDTVILITLLAAVIDATLIFVWLLKKNFRALKFNRTLSTQKFSAKLCAVSSEKFGGKFYEARFISFRGESARRFGTRRKYV